MVEKPSAPLLQDPDLLRVERVHEIGLMRRDEDLRTAPGPAGVLAKLVDQRLQQLVIETVLQALQYRGTEAASGSSSSNR